MAKFKVMIDPGHGKTCVNGGKQGYKEHAGMWALSNYLKAALERRGLTADLTRTYDADPSLTARGKSAKGYDLFISQHSNAANVAANGAARGVECFYSVDLPGDKALAAALSKAVAAAMGNPDRGAKTCESTSARGEDYYTVIDAAQDAGCKHVLLIENGFHDNASDEAFLLSDGNLKLLAEVQARVICEVLNLAEPDGSGGKLDGSGGKPGFPAVPDGRAPNGSAPSAVTPVGVVTGGSVPDESALGTVTPVGVAPDNNASGGASPSSVNIYFPGGETTAPAEFEGNTWWITLPGRVKVKARDVLETLGYTVAWDAVKNTIVAMKMA